MIVPYCEECGEELVDYLDVEAGRCMDCQMDSEDESSEDLEEE